ncbi:TIGR02530 family flagellar biosynthesis protein [Ureibacillus thermophilus]|uniref:Flagellar protein n=1 Tax=Ureibacillus thermophilus TaxID=367743 RepID=A0A4P6UUR6_9BACL|nr:TIGR02530 family flagellar biosynthesis protein [Ureibacillus thermophilus]QBK25638.1 flagellar protein [Ureibacillus thermophilus]
MHRIQFQHVPLQSVLGKQSTKPIEKKSTSFSEQFEHAKNELKISKHANERIRERNIQISEQEWKKVSDKVMEARSKGIMQPLVLMDQAAIIISAKNGTVITVLERDEAKEQLFTNIDGTIVL